MPRQAVVETSKQGESCGNFAMWTARVEDRQWADMKAITERHIYYLKPTQLTWNS